MITLIIELLIMGHVSKMLQIELGYGINSEQAAADKELVDAIVQRFGGSNSLGVFDASKSNANAALSKIMTLSFLMVLFFSLVPLGAYFTFRSSGKTSEDISYSRLIQVYGYSMAPFIPIVALYTLMSPFNRVQWMLLFCAGALTSFYQYKEMIETSKRFLTYSIYQRLVLAILISTFLFILLVKFYFVSS